MASHLPFMTLTAFLVTGDEARARRYLGHFPRAHRVPAKAREALVESIHPEVMAVIDRLHPWLAQEGDAYDPGARILAALAEAGEAGLNRAQLQAKLQGVPIAERDAALERLVHSMEVHVQREKTSGRPANRYRIAEFGRGIDSADIMRNPFATSPRPLD